MIIFRNKEINASNIIGKKVAVYRNLNKNTYSIKSLEKDTYGLVIGYTDKIFLSNSFARVSQSGRRKVILEKRKNVHAYIVGEVAEENTFVNFHYDITYDPYKYETFVESESNTPWAGSPLTQLKIENGKFKILCI